MYRHVQQLAKWAEDKSPKECIFGLKLMAIAFLLAISGGFIAFTVNQTSGSVLAVIGIGLGFAGMSVYYFGFFRKIISYRREMKRVRGEYENSNGTWKKT